MADSGDSIQSCMDTMLAAYNLYDLYVDAVSAFETLCTGNGPMAPHVAHFERFPTLHLDDGHKVTPDFTILFSDGTGVIGELAKFALADASVDKLCKQLGQYDRATHLPSPSRTDQQVGHADVLLIVPMDLTNAAVDRILIDRMNNAEHPYAPNNPPVIVGMMRDASRLLFVHNRAEPAGAITHPELAKFFVQKFKALADFYRDTKVARPFMNDPIDDLYLAARLWAVLPELAAPETREVATTIDEISSRMTKHFERGAKNDIKRALALLSEARLVTVKGNAVTQRRPRLSKVDRQAVHSMVARRACETRRAALQAQAHQQPSPDAPTVPADQPSLF